METYGLVGKSGTGKSYQAMNVCRDHKIYSLIDDGLFIYDNAVQAGHSAKRDENKMKAIKTAIFQNPTERAAVAAKIREINPESILILGTSDSMIEKICERLQLPMPKEIFRIEEIVSQDAINTALRQRRELGKHVIPVPTVEIKSQFSGYFMMPLKIFRSKNNRTSASTEKSVVRPTYSYLGKYTVSDKTVQDIIRHVCMESEGVAEIARCSIRSSEAGLLIMMAVIFDYNTELLENVEKLQQNLSAEIEKMTAFNILGINIIVKGLRPEHTAQSLQNEKKKSKSLFSESIKQIGQDINRNVQDIWGRIQK